MRMNNLGKTVLLALICLSLAVSAFADSFVLRPKYPKVKPIELSELAGNYDQAVIVDVRSSMEYDVIHIAKAVNISMSKSDFVAQLEKVRPKSAAAPLALYCNGYTCAKSYEAAEMAQAAGFQNVFCFDAGVFEWAKAYPDKAALLGKSPVDKAKLISSDDLAKRMLSFTDFKAKSQSGNAVIIDVRDPVQRTKESGLPQSKTVDLPGVRSVPLDRLVGLLQKGEFKGKELLIFDAVGKQVQWLQYYLEEYGYANYAFLKKGVLAAVEAGAAK